MMPRELVESRRSRRGLGRRVMVWLWDFGLDALMVVGAFTLGGFAGLSAAGAL